MDIGAYRDVLHERNASGQGNDEKVECKMSRSSLLQLLALKPYLHKKRPL